MSVPERKAFFDEYIEDVVGRYEGKLQSWDIVNEPFWPGHKAPGGYRLGPWYEAFGTDYVRRAFERAALVDKKTKFVLNEAQTERDDAVGRAVREGLLRLVDELKDAGVPLHAVGLQGHLQPRYPYDAGRFADFVHALAERKVDIYITEFDVRDDTFPDDISNPRCHDRGYGGEVPQQRPERPRCQNGGRLGARRQLLVLYGCRQEEEPSCRAAPAAIAVRRCHAEEAALVRDGARIKNAKRA